MRDIRPNKNSPNDTPPEVPPPPLKKKVSKSPDLSTGQDVPIVPLSVDPPFSRTPVENPEKVQRRKKVNKQPARSNPTPPPKSPATPSKKNAVKEKNAPRIGRREKAIIASLLGLAVIAGALALLIFLPRATVTLSFKAAPLLVEETLTLTADPSTEPATVPGVAFFREVDVTGESVVQGTQQIGTKATGTVQLVNRTFDEQQIKDQSRLVTNDGILFYMQRTATIPPDSRVTVAVEAAEAGEQGNIQAQRLDFAALDETARQVVFAEATESFSGGTGEEVAAINTDDLSRAQEEATTKAQAQVAPIISGELSEDWHILDNSWTTTVEEFTTSASEGDREQTFTYTARVIVRVFAYQPGSIENHLRSVLESRLNDDFMLFPGDLNYTTAIKETNWEDGTARVSARVTHTTVPNISLDETKSKLVGLRKDDATSLLVKTPGVEQVSINLWPFWAQSLPRLEDHVQIEVATLNAP